MIRKGILPVILCFVGGVVTWAQEIRVEGVVTSSDTTSYLLVDKAKVRVSYEMSFSPDVNFPEDKKEALTVLLVGKQYTLFVDYYTLEMDSISRALHHQDASQMEIMNALLPVTKKIQFKPYVINNYPKKGEALFQQKLGMDTYRYTDNHVEMEWEINDSTKEIKGYACKQATCTYRGRNYIAWYSPEVLLNAGPYVFCGLPGLIFELFDTDGEYSFSLCGLQQLHTPISMWIPNRNIENISSKEFRKMEKNLADNPAEVLKLIPGTATLVSGDIKNISPKPYNPIERE